MDYFPIKVVTYNLYWWCVSGRPNTGGKHCPQYEGGKGFAQLYSKMSTYEPYDLIGMQECEGANAAQQIGSGIGYGTSHEWHQGPVDLGMGWNKDKFEKLGDYNSTPIGQDQWGVRYLSWIRLKSKSSPHTIFFANTHGPLPGPYSNCDTNVAKSYIKTVADNIHPKDALIVTGDFNCIGVGKEINYLSTHWTLAANDATTHFDHIYIRNTTTRADKSESHNGHPSDHSILIATISAMTPKEGASSVVV